MVLSPSNLDSSLGVVRLVSDFIEYIDALAESLFLINVKEIQKYVCL